MDHGYSRAPRNGDLKRAYGPYIVEQDRHGGTDECLVGFFASSIV